MNPELIAWLLSWAVFYTGYEMPSRPPIIVYVTHQYFVDSPTCNGIDTYKNPCSVRAAYNDLYTGIIEVDEEYKDKLKLIRSRRKKQALIEDIKWAAEAGEGVHYTEVKKNGQIIGIY